MKSLYSLFTLFVCSLQIPAQVVITNNPDFVSEENVGLTVDGSITVRDKIYVGGDDVNLGDPGKPGQVLVSQGPGQPPAWKTLNIPSIEAGFFYLIYNNAFSDFTNDNTVNEGVLINDAGNANNGNGPYTMGTPRNNAIFNNFTTITGLSKTFDVYSEENQVYITFEAVAHIDSNASNSGVDFVCGIFAGGSTAAERTLRGIRKMTLQQSYGAGNQPFITYTQIALASDLGMGTHSVEVACKRTATYGTVNNLGVGRAAATNINEFTAKTSLKVEVYEIPQVFEDIFN